MTGSTMAELAVRFGQDRNTNSRSRGSRSHARPKRRTTSLLASLGLSTAFAIAGLMFAFSGAAGAAVTTPLVSTSTSASGTALHVTYNETPVLGGSYSLTLTDGSHVATFSSGAGTLSAAVNGMSIDFTVHGGSSVSLSSLVEVLGSTGVSDGSGNPWDLVASGQVGKAYLVARGDQVIITYNEPVNVGSSYSFTLHEGSGSAVIDNGNSNVAAGNGTATVTYDVTSNPSGTVAADGPTVSNVSGVTAVPTLQVGDTLTAVASGATGTITPPYGLTLSDGAGDSGTLSSGTNVTAGSPVQGTPAGDTTFTYTVTGAGPAMTAGTRLLTSGLTATAAKGLGGGAATPFLSLTPSGPLPPSPTVMSDSVSIDVSNLCSNVGVTRVFNGSNCSIGFGNAGPTTPDVYDVIPLPTWDLPGPPNDTAPEVITSCTPGSSDVAYDLNTGAELGSNACGNNLLECKIGNTCGPGLDYIPTPNLASFEEAAVVETMPGSSYVSATAVPPQLSAIVVSGNQATFTYYGNVVCQATSSDGPTISQFTYETPYTNLNKADLQYPSSISCPSGGGANSITVTYPNPIPFSSGVRFKFEGFGPGHFILGAPGSAFAYERQASESAYAGPTATIDSFAPQSTTLSSSSGGPVNVSFGTTNALTCTVGAVSLPASAAALSLPSVASCNGTGTITVPANTDSTTNAVYTVTLTALGVPGTPAANAEITITVPAAPPPPAPIVITPTPILVVPPPVGGKKAHIAAPYARLVLEQISSKNHTAKFRFKATGVSTGFRCALVLVPTRKHAKTPSPKYVACGSSKTFKHLKIGRYVLYVRAVGPGGTRSPVIFRFSIK
jgi:hypothetical protein